jgi:hypothetical protein
MRWTHTRADTNTTVSLDLFDLFTVYIDVPTTLAIPDAPLEDEPPPSNPSPDPSSEQSSPSFDPFFPFNRRWMRVTAPCTCFL